MDAAHGGRLERFEALARQRRTSLLVDAERPVDDELLDRLCRVATWAPNHHRTWPWRFAVLVGDARADLGSACAEHLADQGAPEAKIAKALGKYLRAPAMIVVASAHDEDPATRAENRDAVAAGIQTLLLAATAAGLASFWGTGVGTEAPAVRAMCGFGRDDEVVAAVYVGWPTGEVSVPERPSAIINRP
jgi:nitroreductase